MRKKITIKFATPFLLLDFTGFLYQASFITDYQKNSDLIRHFERTDVFSVTAGIRSWTRLFMYLDELDEATFNNKYGMQIFAIFIYLHNLPEFSYLNITDRLQNDPFQEKKKLFETCMMGLTDFN